MSHRIGHAMRHGMRNGTGHGKAHSPSPFPLPQVGHFAYPSYEGRPLRAAHATTTGREAMR